MRFRYAAIGEDGRLIHGHLDAGNEAAVVQRLEAARQHAVRVERDEARDRGLSRRAGSRFSAVTRFTRELNWLLAAGLPLSRALDFLAEGGESAMRTVLVSLKAGIRAGRSMTDSLSEHRQFFDAAYIDLVRIAEASGTLPSVLAQLAENRTRQTKMRQKVVSSLLYPAILMIVAFASVGVVMLVVLPKLHGLFAGQEARMPTNARLLMETSDWLLANGWPLVFGFLALAALLIAVFRRPEFRRRSGQVLLRLPLAGNLFRAAIAADFCRTLAMLSRAGIGLLPALELLRGGGRLQPYRETLEAMTVALRKGEDYLAPMAASTLFPPLVPAMLRVGAETGNLVPALEQLTALFEDEFTVKTERLLALLEPAVIVSLSIVVGFIVVTVMNGIVSINDLAG